MRIVKLLVAAICLLLAIDFYPAGSGDENPTPGAPAGHGLPAYLATVGFAGLAVGFLAWAGRGSVKTRSERLGPTHPE